MWNTVTVFSPAIKSVSTKTNCKLVRMVCCNKPVVFLLFTSLITIYLITTINSHLTITNIMTSTLSHFTTAVIIPITITNVSPCSHHYEYNGVSLQATLADFITLLFHVILNFQSTKMILGFNSFVFTIFTLIYAKFVLTSVWNLPFI